MKDIFSWNRGLASRQVYAIISELRQ